MITLPGDRPHRHKKLDHFPRHWEHCCAAAVFGKASAFVHNILCIAAYDDTKSIASADGLQNITDGYVCLKPQIKFDHSNSNSTHN